MGGIGGCLSWSRKTIGGLWTDEDIQLTVACVGCWFLLKACWARVSVSSSFVLMIRIVGSGSGSEKLW